MRDWGELEPRRQLLFGNRAGIPSHRHYGGIAFRGAVSPLRTNFPDADSNLIATIEAGTNLAAVMEPDGSFVLDSHTEPVLGLCRRAQGVRAQLVRLEDSGNPAEFTPTAQRVELELGATRAGMARIAADTEQGRALGLQSGALLDVSVYLQSTGTVVVQDGAHQVFSALVSSISGASLFGTAVTYMAPTANDAMLQNQFSFEAVNLRKP